MLQVVNNSFSATQLGCTSGEKFSIFSGEIDESCFEETVSNDSYLTGFISFDPLLNQFFVFNFLQSLKF